MQILNFRANSLFLNGGSINIFDHQNYKEVVNEWIASQPKRGYGQLRKMAESLAVNSVVMSQIFRGDRDLTVEQGVKVARFIGLSLIERDYFLLLLQRTRAGTQELKEIFNAQLQTVRNQAKALKNRIKHSSFTEQASARFYSRWLYSAVRLGVSLPEVKSVSALAERLRLERSVVSEVVAFLLESGLIEERKGRLELGPAVTHVGHDSPYVHRHHINWRLKALQSMEGVAEAEARGRRENSLHYTGPMALSREAADEIRQDLVGLIERATNRATASPSETLSCLNIDWFSF